jgi:uncharacterized protein (TIGR03118 family)
MKRTSALLALCLTMLALAGSLQAENAYLVRNLVSDIPDLADHTDPNLVGAWGISESGSSPFWISDAGTGVTTLYDSSGNVIPLVVGIPASKAGSGAGVPTGTVWNGTTGFQVASGKPAVFLFDSLDGAISGWNPSVDRAHTIIMVDNSSAGAEYTGLAIGAINSTWYLYAANFHAGRIEVYSSIFEQMIFTNGFKDPMIPPGYAPFNIQNLGGKLYVAYAQQNAGQNFANSGPGLGYVDVFDTGGNLLHHLVAGAQLNAPWGLAIAPPGFGDFAGDLLVGNFGDGTINVFNPSTGAYVATLMDPIGAPIVIPGLWALQPGNGKSGGDANAVYLTAGIPGPDNGNHGLFGRLQAAPGVVASGVTSFAGASVAIAPNTWISIKGANLAETTRVWNDGDFVNGALPTEIDGVSVSINGDPAYVYSVSPAQLVVLTSTDLAAPGTATLTTNNKGLISGNVSIQVQALAPAFFTSSDGKHLAATHADGSMVGPAGTNGVTPAKPGETISLYGSGFGATNPAIPDGRLVTNALPLVTPPTITIGGTAVQPWFAGLSGPGEYMFRVTVPATAADGDVPVVAQLGALTTQASLVIAVQH